MASYLADHVVPLLIGRDARRIEDIWQYLYKGAYWRRGPVTMTAIAAVDTALWDICGKTLNAPVYQLLGGASRDSVMVYGHANGATEDDTVAAVAALRRGMGYKAVRAQCAIPGVAHAYGVGRGTTALRAGAEGSCRSRACGAPSAISISCRRCSSACAASVGFDVHLLHDVHHRLTPIEAARLGKEPRAVAPVLAGGSGAGRAAGRRFAPSASTPRRRLRSARCSTSIYDCAQLIEEELIDYIRMTVVHARRDQSSRKVAALAELHPRADRIAWRHRSQPGVRWPPRCTSISSVHNFGIQEYMRHTPETDAVFPHRLHLRRRRDAPGRRARAGRRHRRGEGVAHIPYDPAYLPVNRKLDGTVHSW